MNAFNEKILFSFISLAIISSHISANGIVEFYPKSSASDSYIAKDCFKYIKDNSDSIHDGMTEILISYKGNDWNEVHNLLRKYQFSQFVDNLLHCNQAYKFSGDRDYFYEAYSKSLLLDHLFNLAVKNRVESKADVVEMTDILLNDIKHIVSSNKVSKPETK